MTAEGNRFTYGIPAETQVTIKDIAKHLSKICRFGGATRDFYSVAQHCVIAAQLAAEDDHDAYTQLYILLHDAHEYAIGDIPTPLGNHIDALAGFDLIHEIKADADKMIYDGLGFKPPPDYIKEIVQKYDRIMFATEASQLLWEAKVPAYLEKWMEINEVRARPHRIVPSDCWSAEQAYLTTYIRIVTHLGFHHLAI